MSGMQEVQKPVVLAVGFFDGLHTGHQRVLRRAMARARAINGEAWAMTFDPHPMKVLHPPSAPLMLTSTPHKLDLLRRFGLDGCLLVPFTRRFAAMAAETFLAELERSLPTLSDIFIGEDWRFGRGGKGDTKLLAEWAQSRGIRVVPVILVRRQVALVSSTRIREAISQGRLDMAARLIGRPFSICGSVERGNAIGRTLGYPTANLAADNEVRPPLGIYAVQAIVNRRAYPGLVNFGHHPTVKIAPAPVIELHLMDTRLNLYGRRVEVFFFARIREERKFRSTDVLVRQIGKDVRLARHLLAMPVAKKLWNSTLQRWYPDLIVRDKKKAKKSQRKAEG
jgi:riboflavin kinase/FMN adenylyltransferase